MEQKIIFLDIDGTLTEPGCNEPPESAIWAVRQAQRAGHYVFLCTGRNYDMIRPLLQYGFDGVIASSGGYIECGKNVIFDCPMTEEQRRAAMAVLEENGVFRTVECKDGSYTDAAFKRYLREHAGEGANSELLRWREQIERNLHILPMEAYRGQPVYKIVVTSLSGEQLAASQRLLESDFAFCIHGDKDGFVDGEVVNRKFDKGRAVERVCEYLQISTRNTVAVGDSMNDKEMLEAAGLAICMENGSEALKELADDICPSVQEDGIREAFLKHHLIVKAM